MSFHYTNSFSSDIIVPGRFTMVTKQLVTLYFGFTILITVNDA